MNYLRFFKGIKPPFTRNEMKFTQKDTERAFGNLKIMWKFVSHPIEIRRLKDIARRISTELILHNVVVSIM